MRRVLAAFAIVTAVLFGTDLAATAAPSTDSLNREVSGPYTGRQSFDFFAGGCGFVHQEFDGTYQTDGRTGTFHIEVCVSVGTPFALSGTFTLTTPHGAVLTGLAQGTTDAALGTASLDITLTVNEGTRRFKHVTGTIQLTGTWSVDVGMSGPTSGTLTGDLQR